MEDHVEQTYELSSHAKVAIRNAAGRIHVHGSNESQLKIYASKRAFSQERLDAIEVRVTIEGDTAVIDTIYPPAPEGLLQDRSGTVDYRIYLPQSCTIDIAELANGEIFFDGLRGPSATARLGNGRAVARNCFTALSIEVARGGMDISYIWWEPGDFSLTAGIANGSIRLALPPDAAVEIAASTESGHIRSQFDEEKTPDTRERKIRVGADPGDILMNVRAGTGNIRIERSY